MEYPRVRTYSLTHPVCIISLLIWKKSFLKYCNPILQKEKKIRNALFQYHKQVSFSETFNSATVLWIGIVTKVTRTLHHRNMRKQYYQIIYFIILNKWKSNIWFCVLSVQLLDPWFVLYYYSQSVWYPSIHFTHQLPRSHRPLPAVWVSTHLVKHGLKYPVNFPFWGQYAI